MTYDFNLQLPDDSEEGRAVAGIAAQENVSLSEAARLLLRQAARIGIQGASVNITRKARKEAPSAILERLRTEKARRLNGGVAPARNGNIIGLLADDPDAVQLIREAATERRKTMYGF